MYYIVLIVSQAVISSSKRRFTIEVQADLVDFWSWLLNTLHMDLTGGKTKKRSVITDAFQVEA
jgi:U4/U6.U5 tri-snRNP-associated protein 2